MPREPRSETRNFFQLCTLPEFWKALADRATVIQALKISAVIGTILVLINQVDVVLSGAWPPVWKLILTYCVPYGVSSYSVAAHKVAGHDH